MSSSGASSTSSNVRSHRSTQRGSPSPSPSAVRPADAPTLEVLVGHLLSSKRSLNSIAHLHRASAIISEARATLESTAVVSARSAFLQRSLASQIKIIESIYEQLTSLSLQAQADFVDVLTELDAADARLETAVDGLKSTTVEHSFRPDDEEQKTLASFVDEKPVEEIRESLRSSIDGLNVAMTALQDQTQALENDLSSIKDAITKPDTVMAEDSVESLNVKHPGLAPLLQGMEEHAKEMALGLESLVKHFDLCVTAIRHTEGGGAAAQNIASDLPEGLDVGQHSFSAAGPMPIATEEHAEMLHVLQSDASEVEEVVSEIQDRIGEMELQLSTILAWRDRLLTHSSNVNLAFHRLTQLGAKLPLYTSHTTATFLSTWSEYHTQISSDLESLSSLHDVYANYLAAYDRLIVEVARRKAVEKHMHKIVQDAQAKLEKLYKDDVAERDAFKDEQGDYLPSDIWPGLADPPSRFAFVKDQGGDDDGSIPEVERGRVEEAIKRLKGIESQGGDR